MITIDTSEKTSIFTEKLTSAHPRETEMASTELLASTENNAMSSPGFITSNKINTTPSSELMTSIGVRSMSTPELPTSDKINLVTSPEVRKPSTSYYMSSLHSLSSNKTNSILPHELTTSMEPKTISSSELLLSIKINSMPSKGKITSTMSNSMTAPDLLTSVKIYYMSSRIPSTAPTFFETKGIGTTSLISQDKADFSTIKAEYVNTSSATKANSGISTKRTEIYSTLPANVKSSPPSIISKQSNSKSSLKQSSQYSSVMKQSTTTEKKSEKVSTNDMMKTSLTKTKSTKVLSHSESNGKSTTQMPSVTESLVKSTTIFPRTIDAIITAHTMGTTFATTHIYLSTASAQYEEYTSPASLNNIYSSGIETHEPKSSSIEHTFSTSDSPKLKSSPATKSAKLSPPTNISNFQTIIPLSTIPASSNIIENKFTTNVKSAMSTKSSPASDMKTEKEEGTLRTSVFSPDSILDTSVKSAFTQMHDIRTTSNSGTSSSTEVKSTRSLRTSAFLPDSTCETSAKITVTQVHDIQAPSSSSTKAKLITSATNKKQSVLPEKVSTTEYNIKETTNGDYFSSVENETPTISQGNKVVDTSVTNTASLLRKYITSASHSTTVENVNETTSKGATVENVRETASKSGTVENFKKTTSIQSISSVADKELSSKNNDEISTMTVLGSKSPTKSITHSSAMKSRKMSSESNNQISTMGDLIFSAISESAITADFTPHTSIATPVHCQFTWSTWSQCDQSCGNGTKHRLIIITVYPANGGNNCPTGNDIQSCMIKECPIDCSYVWSNWSSCSKTCGLGEKERTASIIKLPSHAGIACPSSPDKQYCNLAQCTIDCVYEWGNWGICSTTCGVGKRSRYPRITTQPQYGGKECPGGETDDCTMTQCSIDCNFTWQEWSSCDKTCNEGNRFRIPEVIIHSAHGGNECPSMDIEKCTIMSCPGDCGYEWTAWSDCTSTCGQGLQWRNATVHTEPISSGKPCPTEPNIQQCSNGPCAVDCIYNWAEWSACTTLCGKGIIERTPIITTSAVAYGLQCPSKEETDCLGSSCTYKNLPQPSKVIKLKAKADENIWPPGLPDLPGIDPNDPKYKNAVLAIAILPDGTITYLPLDPDDPKTIGMQSLCQTGMLFLFVYLYSFTDT